MDFVREVAALLDQVLDLQGLSKDFRRETPLLGSVPQLDSMAVASVIAALEERFEIYIEDDDLDGETFSTVGRLADFVESKLSGTP